MVSFRKGESVLTVVFFTNFVSPHTLPLCDSLFTVLGGTFSLVETRETTIERRSLGYHLYESRPFVVSYSQRIRLQDLVTVADEADVVLFSLGSADYRIISRRVKKNRLTILLSERLFKWGLLKILDPRLWAQVVRNIQLRNKDVWLLTLGHYAAGDFQWTGFSRDRIRVFGYFPKTENVSFDALWKSKSIKRDVVILWVGRLIDWKRPEDALLLAGRLKALGPEVPWRLEMIGEGPYYGGLERSIIKQGLSDHVSLVGRRSQDEVLSRLREGDILVVTSNRREGWGAVVNEGMGRGCAVVATMEGGGAREMIADGENGRLFKTGDLKSLTEIVCGLIENAEERQRLGARAYASIADVWNPECAAKRLVEGLGDRFRVEIDGGPLSRPKCPRGIGE